jgi:hypothetical protein
MEQRKQVARDSVKPIMPYLDKIPWEVYVIAGFIGFLGLLRLVGRPS